MYYLRVKSGLNGRFYSFFKNIGKRQYRYIRGLATSVLECSTQIKSVNLRPVKRGKTKMDTKRIKYVKHLLKRSIKHINAWERVDIA